MRILKTPPTVSSNKFTEIFLGVVVVLFSFAVIVFSIYLTRNSLTDFERDGKSATLPEPTTAVYNSESSKWRPSPEPTPTPFGYAGTMDGWMNFKDPAGFHYKVPVGWIVQNWEPDYPDKDHVIEVNIYEPDTDFDSMPVYDFMEIKVPVLKEHTNKDILNKYQKTLIGLKTELENNPPRLGSISYSLGSTNGYPSLTSIYIPGDPPEWWEADWSYKRIKNVYIQIADDLITSVTYWWDGDTNRDVFEEILSSIRIE